MQKNGRFPDFHLRRTMIFYNIYLYLYAFKARVFDSVMIDCRLNEAAAFVKLLHIVHPKCRSAELVSENSSSMDMVEVGWRFLLGRQIRAVAYKLIPKRICHCKANERRNVFLIRYIACFQAYIKLEARLKTHLDLALQSYNDVAEQATA